jgi:hypothetical protein
MGYANPFHIPLTNTEEKRDACPKKNYPTSVEWNNERAVRPAWRRTQRPGPEVGGGFLLHIREGLRARQAGVVIDRMVHAMRCGPQRRVKRSATIRRSVRRQVRFGLRR